MVDSIKNSFSRVDPHQKGRTADVSAGTAKGGVLVAIAEAYDLPIHFIGIGEKAEDLRPFSAEAFSKALVGLQS